MNDFILSVPKEPNRKIDKFRSDIYCHSICHTHSMLHQRRPWHITSIQEINRRATANRFVHISLTDDSEDPQEPEKVENDDSKLNFTKLIVKEQTTWLTAKPVLTGDIIISYQQLEKVYGDFALYRIRLRYAELQRQIHFLDALSLVRKNDRYKKKHQYDRLVAAESMLRQCLDLCISLQKDQVQWDRIQAMCQKTPFQKYYTNSNHIPDQFIKQLIHDFDQHLPCQYLVMLSELRQSNITYPFRDKVMTTDTELVPLGLASTLYLDCGIKFDLTTCLEDRDDTILADMTATDVEHYLYDPVKIDVDHTIILKANNGSGVFSNVSGQRDFCIKIIQQETRPTKSIIRVVDPPLHVSVLSSIISGKVEMPTIKFAPLHKTKSTTPIPTDREYRILDKLFWRLHQADQSQTLIRPQMLESFYQLALT